MAVFSSQTSSSTGAVELPSWTFDPHRSEVSFRARRMGTTWVNGRFKDVRGTFYWDRQDPLRANCVGEIDVASLHAGEPHLNTQLRTADFLDPRHHPTIDFAARVRERTGESEFQAAVLLTLHGTSRQLAMSLSYLGEWQAPLCAGDGDARMATRLGLRAQGAIRRQDFEVAEPGDPAGGDRAAGNVIEIALDLEAVLDEDLRGLGAAELFPGSSRV